MVKVAGLEYQILEKAADAIHREAGLRLTVKEKEPRIGDFHVDAIIEIGGCNQPFAVEIKKWAVHKNLGAIIDQVKRLPMDGILVADYVNPNMADRLKEEGVQFIDVAGNAYINKPPIYVYVKGNRKRDEGKIIKEERPGRAFSTTGLKVIYAFLYNPALINATYREIADVANVALGTVGWVLNDLKALRFVIGRGRFRDDRRLMNYRKLLDRWVEAYPEKLRPKQKVGEFVAQDPYWWKEINIKNYGAYWGGEVAAAKYTDYLKPGETIVYLPKETDTKLFQDARLRKATEQINIFDQAFDQAFGQAVVKIYRPFWKKPENYNGLVHPILAYADLIDTGDSRNLETAKILYDKYIAEYCREN